jgi:hypothetical protein
MADLRPTGRNLKVGCLHPVALDRNPEPDLVHATGCKKPTLRLQPVGRKSAIYLLTVFFNLSNLFIIFIQFYG